MSPVMISRSLRLESKDDRGTVYTAPLLSTPSLATEWILGGGFNRAAILERYFVWLEGEVGRLGPGALLDHKLAIAMFIVTHDNARFYGA